MDENKYQIQAFRQKKTIAELEKYVGNHTSLISLLIPPGTQPSKISTLLSNEIGTASSIKSSITGKAVQEALTIISGKMKQINIPENGLCIYCGQVKTEVQGKTDRFIMLLEPIKPIDRFIYKCDTHFIVEPLRNQLDSHEKYGFIILNGESALFATLHGSAREVLHQFYVCLPRKHNKGGQSSNRFAHLRTEARHNYITKVIEIAKKSFISQSDANKLNVKGIILAGCADFKDVLKERLDGPLSRGIISSVDISYGGEQGFSEAIEKSMELLKHVSIMYHKQILSKFFESISKDGDVIFGIKETIDALENGAVDLMIVWDKLPNMRHVIKNGQEKSVIYSKNKNIPPKIPSGSEIIESEYLVDWLAEHYTEFGIKLEIVTDSSPEGSQFCNGFGGMGALLRYAYISHQVNEHAEDPNEDLYGDVWDQKEEDFMF